jgi:hypothetical protein
MVFLSSRVPGPPETANRKRIEHYARKGDAEERKDEGRAPAKVSARAFALTLAIQPGMPVRA